MDQGVDRGGECWLFGYGSLVWRPAFEYLECHPARLDGWARRFWQASVDHRGVPGAPGRVVTLVEDPDEHVWGVAYRLGGPSLADTMSALDFREKGGYSRFEAEVALRDAPRPTVTATVYVGTSDNPNYAGPAPVDEIAATIVRSVGPSGPNVEYLLELDAALGRMGIDDPHVRDLAGRVRSVLATSRT